jgi:hypothetical protein
MNQRTDGKADPVELRLHGGHIEIFDLRPGGDLIGRRLRDDAEPSLRASKSGLKIQPTLEASLVRKQGVHALRAIHVCVVDGVDDRCGHGGSPRFYGDPNPAMRRRHPVMKSGSGSICRGYTLPSKRSSNDDDVQRRTNVAGARCAGAAYMLFLDGVYVDGANGSSTRFRWAKTPTNTELTALAHAMADRRTGRIR